MKQKTRVLHIINSLRKGGAERVCIDICNELANYQNIEVKILILENVIEYQHLNKKVDIVFIKSKIQLSVLKKDKIDNREYVNFINSYKPAIIHSHLIYADIMSLSYIIPNTAFISHIHNKYPVFKKLNFLKIFNKKIITNYYERNWLINNHFIANTSFIACSKGVYEFLIKNTLFSKNKIHLVKNGTTIDSFYPQRNKSSEKIRLLSIATLNDVKNHSFMLIVVNELKKYLPNIELNILGDGANREKLLKEIKLLNLEETVFLLGTVDNIQEYLSQSHLFVHTSSFEGLPIVFIEALASGLPIITTPCVEDGEIVKNGYNGFIIPFRDTKGFVEKTIELINNQSLYQELSLNAIKSSKDFDIKKLARNIVNLYNQKLSIKDPTQLIHNEEI